MHCVVETIHNIVESHVSNSREKWRSPQVETDSYVIIPVAMPFQVRIFFYYIYRYYIVIFYRIDIMQMIIIKIDLFRELFTIIIHYY